jgi:hypothetical protein
MLIGLCGKPQSGKSSVRFILERQFGFETINVKLPIIKACHELTGVPTQNFTTGDGKASYYKGVPLRVIMGDVGAIMETLFGEYHTIERALEEHNLRRDTKFVVDSLRMSQPLKFPGKVIEVKSNRSFDSPYHFDKYDDSKVDFTITNNGTFAALEDQIAKIMDELSAT